MGNFTWLRLMKFSPFPIQHLWYLSQFSLLPMLLHIQMVHYKSCILTTTWLKSVNVTGPAKTGHICANYMCSEKGTFLGAHV